MNFKELLAKLNQQRVEKMAAASKLHETVTAEGRTFSEDEQKQFDLYTSAVESIDKQIKSTEQMERLGAGGAQGVPGDGQTGQTGQGAVNIKAPGSVQVVRNLPKGAAFTRYAMILAASKGNLMQAAETAKMYADSTPEVERVLRAAVAAGTTTDSAWAEPLVDYKTMSSEFIELLRPETILGRMLGTRAVPFNVRIPRQTAGSSVGWVGEGNPKPVSKLGFETVTMPETKIAGIVVITMELARFSSPAAEELVRRDMIETIAAYTDAQFINPGIAGSAGVNPASITNGGGASASSGTTLAQIETDLKLARQSLTNANISLQGAYWVMSPGTRMHLAEMRTAQDVLAFPGVEGGMLKGLPIIDSNGVGTYDQDGVGAGAAAGYIALVSAPNVLLADDGQVMLDSSSEASISMTDDGSGTTMTSLWQRNMLGLRAERMMHWLRRRAATTYVIYNVTY